jgi:hypothetical protein
MTAEMDIYQDMVDDPATLTSQLFSMPCNVVTLYRLYNQYSDK